MINNRQSGRRRGRGGGGPRSPNQGPSGNRQDNRSRGNAAQLLEKYKSLARDAQLSGDRVQTEYWLQFADHYFRVLSENRPRFEEQRPRRDDFSEDYDDQDEGVSADGDEGDEDGDERDIREDRPDRQDRQERSDRQERQDRPERQDRGFRADRQDRPERPRREYRDRGAEPRPERNGESRPERVTESRPERVAESRPERAAEGRPERSAEGRPERNGEARRPRVPRREEEASERISLEVLPPAISPAISVVEGDAPAKPRRTRVRRPRADESGEEIAPAA